MPIDIFEKGPSAYIPYLLLALAVTLLEYMPIPIMFAVIRQRGISTLSYGLVCWLGNAAVMIILMVVTGGVGGNGAAFALWTCIANAIGRGILNKKNILY